MKRSYVNRDSKVTNEVLYTKMQSKRNQFQDVIYWKLQQFRHTCKINDDQKIKLLVFGIMRCSHTDSDNISGLGTGQNQMEPYNNTNNSLYMYFYMDFLFIFILGLAYSACEVLPSNAVSGAILILAVIVTVIEMSNSNGRKANGLR